MIDSPPMGGLLPDERVLWRGRLAVGATWPSFGRLALFAVEAWVALAAPLFLVSVGLRASSAHGPSPLEVLLDLAALVGAFVGAAAVVLALSKVVGPAYLRLVWLLLVGPPFVGAWLMQVEHHGWGGALERLRVETLLFPAVFVGLPALSVVGTLVARLDATCVVTDHRLLEVDRRGRITRERWHAVRGTRPTSEDHDLRVVRSWRAPGGLLAAGPAWAPLELALRDDDPALVLELVRAVRREAPPPTPRPGA